MALSVPLFKQFKPIPDLAARMTRGIIVICAAVAMSNALSVTTSVCVVSAYTDR